MTLTDNFSWHLLPDKNAGTLFRHVAMCSSKLNHWCYASILRLNYSLIWGFFLRVSLRLCAHMLMCNAGCNDSQFTSWLARVGWKMTGFMHTDASFSSTLRVSEYSRRLQREKDLIISAWLRTIQLNTFHVKIRPVIIDKNVLTVNFTTYMLPSGMGGRECRIISTDKKNMSSMSYQSGTVIRRHRTTDRVG